MGGKRDRRSEARGLYVFDRLDMRAVARRAGVSEGTARRWKKAAAAEGDCWDKARAAASLAGTGMENATAVLLEDFIALYRSVVDGIRSEPSTGALAKAEALAKLADAFNKTINAAGRASPRLSELAMAQDVIKRLGDFVAAEYPQHGEAFLEILEPFARELGAVHG